MILAVCSQSLCPRVGVVEYRILFEHPVQMGAFLELHSRSFDAEFRNIRTAVGFLLLPADMFETSYLFQPLANKAANRIGIEPLYVF